ncbi:MAG: sigma-54-dependent Fis family transcriptional regulator [Polyangiaceae bacterium]|nr:sigma-54-dependent Fis family transcriptional regulator [Polyangiaceae bacterium]
MSNDHDSSAHGGRDSATRPSASREHDAGRLEISVERERGGERPRRCTTDGLRRVRIGASPSCDVVLDDPEVSRIHCEIRSRGTAWELVDLGSLNGTFADGLRIRDADLPERDVVVSLGSSSLRVRAGAAKPSEGSAHTTLGPVVFGRLYGASQPMRRLFARVERIASTETDVLIEGESGTGKELVTAEIVSRSKRAKAPLIIVDCGALAPSLVESELFGHKKGAFTGADRDRAGAFELADGGTVFLDEIGELPLALQPKLLRALAAREIRRLGETTTRTVDVRVIAATNRRLEVEVNQGRFREDLYFRLSVIRVGSRRSASASRTSPCSWAPSCSSSTQPTCSSGSRPSCSRSCVVTPGPGTCASSRTGWSATRSWRSETCHSPRKRRSERALRRSTWRSRTAKRRRRSSWTSSAGTSARSSRPPAGT